LTTMAATDFATEIADSVRVFVREQMPLARLRNDQYPAVTAAQWRGLADLGLFGIGMSESLGGLALGAFEEALALREVARVVGSPSIFATMLAGHLAAAGSQAGWCQALLAGERRAHLVLARPDGADALCIDQREPADGALLVAVTAAGVTLLESGFTAERPVHGLDGGATVTGGRLDLAAGAIHAAEGTPLADRALLLLAAQLVGLAEEARDLTVAYAGTREQFGRPIGSFQAVKHRCADMAVQAEVAWAQVERAARAFDRGATTPLQVAVAKWLGATAAHRCADSAIQVHGGIGYQAECDVHQFMKRAHLLDQAGGSRSVLAHRIASTE